MGFQHPRKLNSIGPWSYDPSPLRKYDPKRGLAGADRRVAFRPVFVTDHPGCKTRARCRSTTREGGFPAPIAGCLSPCFHVDRHDHLTLRGLQNEESIETGKSYYDNSPAAM